MPGLAKPPRDAIDEEDVGGALTKRSCSWDSYAEDASCPSRGSGLPIDLPTKPSPIGYSACNLESGELLSPSTLPMKIPSPPKTSVNQWALATCFQLVYNLICTIFGAYILPHEANRLNAVGGSKFLGFYMSLCGISQLVCPIAGKISDRHLSPLGRRRPWMIYGTGIAVPGLVLMSLSSTFTWPSVFPVALFVSMLALNVVYSAHCGIPADIQSNEPKTQQQASKGLVSGMMATYSFLGSLCAMALLVLTQGMPVRLLYLIVAVLMCVSMFLVFISVNEESTDDRKHEPMTTRHIIGTFLLDPVKEADFMWICLGRMFYYVSSSNASFQLYYIRDMLHVSDAEEQRTRLATLLVTIMSIGAVVAFSFSSYLTRMSRKTVIYAACGIMTLCFLLLASAPILSPNGAWTVVLIAGIVGGVGNACYLSVDYALALDCLPAGKTSAEAFGLWGVAGFMGSTLGPMVVGYILSANVTEIVSSGDIAAPFEEKYSYVGYACSMFLLGPVANIIVIACTSKIKGAK